MYGRKTAALADFTVRQEAIEDVLEAVKTLRTQPRTSCAGRGRKQSHRGRSAYDASAEEMTRGAPITST